MGGIAETPKVEDAGRSFERINTLLQKYLKKKNPLISFNTH